MDTVAVNGATIARMVDFLTRELDAAQKKLEELKQEKENAQARIEELNLVNNQLRGKVDELESGRVRAPVKRETQDDENPLFASGEAQDQSSRDAEKDARIKELEKSVEEYHKKFQRMGNQTRHDSDPETSSQSDDDDDDESEDDTQSADEDEEEDDDDDDDESGSDEEEQDVPSGVHDLESAQTRNAFSKILGDFPRVKGRPTFKKLRPVCASKINLEKYLASDPRTSWFVLACH